MEDEIPGPTRANRKLQLSRPDYDYWWLSSIAKNIANVSQDTRLQTLLKMLYEFLRHHPCPLTPAINQHLTWDPHSTLCLPIPQPA